MHIPVDAGDASCHVCGGPLVITDVDDGTLTVACQGECHTSYLLEPDAMGDGGTHYWQAMLARKLGEDGPLTEKGNHHG